MTTHELPEISSSGRGLLACVLVLALAPLSPGQEPVESGPVPPEPAGVEVELTLSLEPAPAVELEVAAPGSDSGVTRFSVASTWGGVSAGGEDLEPVAALGRDGRALALERPEPPVVVVRHEPGEPLVLRYRIAANRHRESSDPDVSRRPVVDATLFHAYGHLALMLPEHLAKEDERAVRLRWRGFEQAGWEVACSFGLPTGGELDLCTSLAKLQSAVYLAGALRVHRLEAAGGPLAVAIAGDRWRFDDDELVSLVGRIVAAERSFFDDGEHDFYLVGLIPAGPPAEEGTRDMGGTALTSSFSLIMRPNASLVGGAGLDLARLLAHEYFHQWNGHVLRRVEPEELVCWFSEGFTDFYARRMLVRAGLLDAEGFARSVEGALRAYLTSPVREASNERVLADYWDDREVQRLPYHRGDLIAMLLDRELRAVSDGERGLDELMRALVREGRAGLRVSTEGLLARFGEAGASELVPLLSAALDGGHTLPVPGDLFAPCLDMELVEEPVFEAGFDVDRTLAERVVHGVVPGSRAHAAGLRDGQPVRGLSVHRGRTDRPVEVTVVDGGRERRIEYEPLGERVALPRFTPVRGADCSRL